MSNGDLYDVGRTIGQGAFGTVRKVRWKEDGRIFARKELNWAKMSDRDKNRIMAEVEILEYLHHDHIVRYRGHYVDEEAGMLYIFMEYCGGGDLSEIIKQGQHIPERQIWCYLVQILLALQHCHHPNEHGRNRSTGSAGVVENADKERRAQILHRDVKPDNVFLDENHNVKLGDFGVSKALPEMNFTNTCVGTPYYMSPELLQERNYDFKTDIWSLGCLIYELCALKPPFRAKTRSELITLICKGPSPSIPKGYSKELGRVIKKMLDKNPATRPSATQLLQDGKLVSEMSFYSLIDPCFIVDAVSNFSIKSTAAIIAQKNAQISSLEQRQQAYKQTEDNLLRAIAEEKRNYQVLMRRREEANKQVAELDQELMKVSQRLKKLESELQGLRERGI
ncbi:kinase-like protein [Dendrothele bispora CBS 962.96]|uniref:non-specific serine/threonine protein kinase n=1 Tax=Dendrothele bispora (strain CBS 962.96) TaxID=1314807 RepID=A0A4S8M7K2_DENBC|nr:kinase-like protein [Dendrothele bispora CBS 962.96]THU98130.1 kinase-like protein [Dendrothele bispora CBS 962.96]